MNMHSEQKLGLGIIAALLLLAFVLHVGSVIQGGLYADDYIHAAYFSGDKTLAKKGLLAGIDHSNVAKLLPMQFSFFDPSEPNYQALKDYGVLPWWTADDALLHFYRPIATLTHWLDYKLWPDNTHAMHAMNLLWYMLAVLAILYLYQQFALPKVVLALALLMVILDASVYQVSTWIASRSMLMLMAFGFLSVAFYRKACQQPVYYLLSIICFVLSMFCAEGFIGICAYLGAYMLVYDARSWGRRLLAISPFVMLTLLWRIYYQTQGYGAQGVEFYIDPGRDIERFLSLAAYRLPGNFFELVSSVDIMSGQVRPDIRQNFAYAGVTVFALLLWLNWQAVKSNKTVVFFALGSLFALVPGLSVVLAPRVMILPNVGFAIVAAFLIYHTFSKAFTGVQKVAAFITSGLMVLMHVLVALGLCVFMLYGQLSMQEQDSEQEPKRTDVGVQYQANKSVVILTSDRPFWTVFIPYELAYEKQVLPEHVRVLSSAFYPAKVIRVDRNRISLDSMPAFQFDAQAVADLTQQAHGHHAYLTQQLLGLVRANDTQWKLWQRFEFPEMTIEVTKLCEQKPCRLLVTFKRPLTEYQFTYWDKASKRYQEVELPELGESIELQGFFE